MAKNSQIYSANNPYGNRDEEIRKAKGNPNKNIHAKKKNSNYGGYNGAAACVPAAHNRNACRASCDSIWYYYISRRGILQGKKIRLTLTCAI